MKNSIIFILGLILLYLYANILLFSIIKFLDWVGYDHTMQICGVDILEIALAYIVSLGIFHIIDYIIKKD